MSYIRQWKRLPARAGFLLGSFPLAVFAFAVLATLFSAGVGLAIVGIGIVVLQYGLRFARVRGDAWRAWVVRADGRSIPAPRPDLTNPQANVGARQAGATPLPAEHRVRAFLHPLTVTSDWRAMLHQGLLGFLLTMITWTLAVTWAAFAVVGPLYWLLLLVVPRGQDNIGLSQLLWPDRVGPGLEFAPDQADSILYAILGVIFLLTLPVVYRGLTALHWSLARALLGETPEESLRRVVAVLESSRGAAAAAENRTLGQLERDLHDGPQQRLVRLQMDLATAERRLADDPDAAARLLGEARGTAQDTLDELRALSRGFAPPILGDRGIGAALETLAARGPMPIDLQVTATAQLSPELERNLYFVAAELVTNAAKHSGAQRVTLQLRDGVAARDAVAVAGSPSVDKVVLEVSDSGRGGIIPLPGHGLAGLTERLRGIGGTLTLSSPAGGPSIVTAVVPVSLGE
ncbi:sensor histidine kinase [Leucobacter komagatae]|uniref:histidine kinase n=1 Tax=Leucobacter komagatae TaxID=55969 RepID=A0A0D0I1C0_9MICO|nr:sensor histidine kinase [Leucobacter komagatae]KIP53506.1 hypothetical protein SD72_02055 [Leucobacter komagatae]